MRYDEHILLVRGVEKGALFSGELIVLLDRLLDVPRAHEALPEDYQVALSDFYRGFSTFGRDDHLAFEKIAGFFGIVTPGEIRDLLRPDRPLKDAQFFEFFPVRFMIHYDSAH
jgi:hypothetical protein